MLILKYFATTGMLLCAALLALNAYFYQSGPNAARLPLSATVTSQLPVPPATQTSIVTPDVPQPKVAATSAAKSNSAHHRHRVR
jgi:hypothetical protein